MEKEVNTGTKESPPLFSHFLTIRRFSMLFVAGIIIFIAGFYVNGVFADLFSKELNFLTLIIFLFLAPYVGYAVKGILNSFLDLFNEDPYAKPDWHMRVGSLEAAKIGYLFSEKPEFEHYRKSVRKMMFSRKEKYVAILLSFCLIFPLTLMQDYQSGALGAFLSRSTLGPIVYFCQLSYWCLVDCLLFSGVWMIITVLIALLNLEREKSHLDIYKSVAELRKGLVDPKELNLTKTRVELLDYSFRRFKAGLSPIVSFIDSSSLKIAFVGTLCTIPSLINFRYTGQVNIVWYGLDFIACFLSVAVFVIGQFGVWRLWRSSKKDATNVLDHLCSLNTQRCSELYETLSSADKNQSKGITREIERIEASVNLTDKLRDDIEKLTAITYTSSSIFKIVSINFLSFGPIMLEILLLPMLR